MTRSAHAGQLLEHAALAHQFAWADMGNDGGGEAAQGFVLRRVVGRAADTLATRLANHAAGRGTWQSAEGSSYDAQHQVWRCTRLIWQELEHDNQVEGLLRVPAGTAILLLPMPPI